MPAPANDLCANAIDITSLPYSATQSTVSATNDTIPSTSILGTNSIAGVWHKITSATAKRLRVSHVGSDFDTVLMVWKGTCGGLLFVAQGYDDISNATDADGPAAVEWNAEAGVEYLILSSGYPTFSTTGNLTLTVSEVSVSNTFSCRLDVSQTFETGQTITAMGWGGITTIFNPAQIYNDASSGNPGWGLHCTTASANVVADMPVPAQSCGRKFVVEYDWNRLYSTNGFGSYPNGGETIFFALTSSVGPVYGPNKTLFTLSTFRMRSNANDFRSLQVITAAQGGINEWFQADGQLPSGGDGWKHVKVEGFLSSGYDSGSGLCTADAELRLYIGGVLIFERIGIRIENPLITNGATVPWDYVTLGPHGNIDNVFATSCCPTTPTPPAERVPIPPASSATPIAAQIPCTPDTQVTGGGTGASGCNEGGVGWTPDYFGPYGDVPQHPDPTPGEILRLGVPIDIWAEVDQVDYPSGLVTTIRRSMVELADDPAYYGGRKPAGLLGVGDLEHGVGNEEGAFESGNVDFEWSDIIDRAWRTLCASQELAGCEGRIYAATPQGRAAGVPARLLFRGIVEQTQFNNPLKAHLSVSDILFAEGGPLGPDRMFPPLIPMDIFTTAPPDMSTKALPWLYGEKSDKGAVDPVTNIPKEKGLCPLLYVGQEAQTSTQWVSAASTQEQVTACAQTGVPGTIIGYLRSYITCVVGGVEGPLSPQMGNMIRLQNGVPDTLIPHGIRANWGRVDGVDSYRIYFFWDNTENSASTDAFNPLTGTGLGSGFCRVLTHDNTTYDGFLNGELWGDMAIVIGTPTDGVAYPGPFNAVGSQGSFQPVTELWDAYIAFGHPVFRILEIFGSDLGGGDPTATHDRVRLFPDERNDLLVPGYASWPYPTTYREYTSPTDGKVYWLTMVYAKGPLSDDAKKGVVNFACNAIGRMDDLGLPLRHYHRCEQSWFENEVFGYWTSGPQADTVTFPQFADGTAKVRTSRFLARQLYTAEKLGANSALGAGVGLTCGWYMGDAKPMLDHVKDLNDGSETRIGVNGFGQITLGYVDERLDPTTWPRVDHITDLFGDIAWSLGEQRENPSRGVADWDPDKSKFRIEKIEQKDPIAYTKFKNRWKPGDILQLVTLNWTSEVEWVLAQRNARLSEGETIGHVQGAITLLNNDVDGDGILLTTIEGTGAAGFVNHELEIRRRAVAIGSLLVTYTLRDLSQELLTARFGPDALTRIPIQTSIPGKGPIQTSVPGSGPLELS